MKKLLIALLLIAAMASPAVAGPIQMGYENSPTGWWGPYKSAHGGEYTLNPLTGWLPLTGYAPVTTNAGVPGTFQSFCIDTTDPILGFPTMYDGVLSPTMDLGGVPNQVSVGSGWLYSQFAMGTLAGYNYGLPTRLDSAFALQATLWWLEGFAVDPMNIFSTAVVAHFGTLANARMDGGQNYGVYALNLRYLTGAPAQDMLFFVPDGGATLMLLGGALMGLGALRRKFRR